MKKLLIATKNPGKFAELRLHLTPYGFECLGLKDAGINEDVEETGKTFKENALLKVKTYAKMSGLLTMAEDGGLTIDVLNGEPGIRSRNLTGQKRNTDQELIDYIIDKMKNVPDDQSTAKLVAAIAICDPEGKCFVEEAYTDGYITKEVDQIRIEGYPYRSIFHLKEFDKMYSRLNDEEIKMIAHRAEAVKKLSKYFKEYD